MKIDFKTSKIQVTVLGFEQAVASINLNLDISFKAAADPPKTSFYENYHLQMAVLEGQTAISSPLYTLLLKQLPCKDIPNAVNVR